MGAAYSSFGRTKVLYATSLVLLGAKAKFLRRKPSVLVALEDILPDFPPWADEIAEPHQDMNIKATAFTVTKQLYNIAHK